jgi:hypothetical protein
MVEGDPGCGKSNLLARFMSRAAVKLPYGKEAPPFFVTTALPFHPRPFGVWCAILQQYLDLAVAKNGNDLEPDDDDAKESTKQVQKLTPCKQ